MNKKWLFKPKFFKLFYKIKADKAFIFIIKIIAFSIFLKFNNNIINLNIFVKLFKEIKNGENVRLYMKNKTEFYYKYRINFLKQNNISYNESNIITFQDKLNYLIIHDNPESKSDIVDKIKIHQFSKKILGKDICVPILKIYKNVDEIKLEDLPEKFVLKANHGSGMNLICKDKSKFDINMAKNNLKIWLRTNYGLLNSEFQYFLIERKILAAPYLGDNIIDYEIYCF